MATTRHIWRRMVNVTGNPVTITFYAASSSGGSVNVLNTVVINDIGLVTSWTQSTSSGLAGAWLFDDPDQSGQYLTVGF